MEYKKKILNLAKEHQKAGDLEKVDRYYMPKDDVVRVAHLWVMLKISRKVTSWSSDFGCN